MQDEKLRKSVVIGAGGKMGRGIALVLLQEMAFLKDGFELVLIDTNPASFLPLKHYLQSQLLRLAEKNINSLRELYSSDKTLISNEEIIHAFVENALERVRYGTELGEAKDSLLIFEAIAEDTEIKVKVLSTLRSLVSEDAFFFSNTSSIPIKFLNEKANLNDRIIGYHFYNPPAVQKLLEIIPPKNVDQELSEYAHELAGRLKKIVVESQDVAGFIGNGYFLREILFACQKVEQQENKCDAIELINYVTKEYLVRPMGIFQLVDYVGLDVCANVAKIMHTFLGIPIGTTLIQEMIQDKKMGGQNPDGSQNDGFFQYDRDRIVGVYDLAKKSYRPLTERDSEFSKWKELLKDPEKDSKLRKHFENLKQQKTNETLLAQEFLKNSNEIANQLVKDHVAKSIDDVNRILINGFYHLYGADVI